jgi:hypothetical protein
VLIGSAGTRSIALAGGLLAGSAAAVLAAEAALTRGGGSPRTGPDRDGGVPGPAGGSTTVSPPASTAR